MGPSGTSPGLHVCSWGSAGHWLPSKEGLGGQSPGQEPWPGGNAGQVGLESCVSWMGCMVGKEIGKNVLGGSWGWGSGREFGV